MDGPTLVLMFSKLASENNEKQTKNTSVWGYVNGRCLSWSSRPSVFHRSNENFLPSRYTSAEQWKNAVEAKCQSLERCTHIYAMACVHELRYSCSAPNFWFSDITMSRKCSVDPTHREAISCMGSKEGGLRSRKVKLTNFLRFFRRYTFPTPLSPTSTPKDNSRN